MTSSRRTATLSRMVVLLLISALQSGCTSFAKYADPGGILRGRGTGAFSWFKGPPADAASKQRAIVRQPRVHPLSQVASCEEERPCSHSQLKIIDWPAIHRTQNISHSNARGLQGSHEVVKELSEVSRPHIYIRYPACLGLANQLYSHITMFALAARIGADLVLPPAAHRSSFQYAYDSTEAHWQIAPTSTMLDVNGIISFWQQKGIAVHRTPYLNYTEAADPDKPVQAQVFVHPDLVVAIKKPAVASMEDIANLVYKTAQRAVSKFQKTYVQEEVRGVLVEFPCSFQMMNMVSDLEAISMATESLKIAPQLIALAVQVIEGVLSQNPEGFNGVHLRVEGDAITAGYVADILSDTASTYNSTGAFVDRYIQGLLELSGSTHAMPVYIASGLLGYMQRSEFDNLVKPFITSRSATTIHYKERYLDKDVLSGLHSEAKALIDVMVLLRCQYFVGMVHSSMSHLVREFRVRLGLSRTTALLLGTPLDSVVAHAMMLSSPS